MFQGNWKCSKCGGAITELPFQPRSEAGLTCRTCYAKSKDPAGGGSSYQNGAPADTSTLGASTHDDRDVPDFADFDAPSSEPMSDNGLDAIGATAPADKPRTTGNWQCATCGAAITSLPFTPRDVTSLKCIDCFKRSKA